MFKSATIAILTTVIVATPAFASGWISDTNIGAQGVQGAYAINLQDGLFDLRFECSAALGMNRTIFMTLNTLPDAPLYPGNETQFPVTMVYTFSNGSVATSEIDVEWARDDRGINIWHSTFPMNQTFLNNFARSTKLELLYGGVNGLIFTYSMGGSAKSTETLVEYCYSGNYN